MKYEIASNSFLRRFSNCRHKMKPQNKIKHGWLCCFWLAGQKRHVTFSDLDTFYCVLKVSSVDLMQITKIQLDRAMSYLNQIGCLGYEILCGFKEWRMESRGQRGKKGRNSRFFSCQSNLPATITHKPCTFNLQPSKRIRNLCQLS